MTNSTKKTSKNIGLALSGGGVRASAFHAGVLLYLAEQTLLEEVKHVSSVFGGTLFTGLVFTRADFHWPTSNAYIRDIFPYIRETLTTKSLQKEMLLRLFYPRNLNFCLSRVNILAQSIKELWNINGTLSDLPPQPVWSINGSTLETGQRFSFKACRLGDEELGYADAPDFDLASAMAVSAALPTAIGPLELQRDAFTWTKEGHDTNIQKTTSPYQPPYETINIYDGGVYDNLGIESLFDVGTQSFTNDSGIDFIISSDAGSPYEQKQIGNACDPQRLERLMHLLVDQSRSLRARSLMHFLRANPQRGLYCYLGTMPHKLIQNNLPKHAKELLRNNTWLSEKEILYAQRYKTTLNRLKSSTFDIIARHGYESAKLSHQIGQTHSPYGSHPHLQTNPTYTV